MNAEQINQALTDALPLRSPTFEPGTGGRAKVGALEDYMLLSASVNGNLVEARHWLRLLEEKIEDDWEKLQGWEVFAPSKPRGKLTKQDIQDAKIKAAPEKYTAGRRAMRLRVSIEDQIARLEREERVCSRAYTMVTGG